MRARVLGPEEWGQFDSHEVPLLPFVSPENVSVVVVEDGAGKVVARMTVARVTHFEGAWIEPEHRGNAGVVRALLRLASELARAHEEQWVFAGAADDRMRGVLDRLGAVPVPMDTYALSLGGESCRPQ